MLLGTNQLTWIHEDLPRMCWRSTPPRPRHGRGGGTEGTKLGSLKEEAGTWTPESLPTGRRSLRPTPECPPSRPESPPADARSLRPRLRPPSRSSLESGPESRPESHPESPLPDRSLRPTHTGVSGLSEQMHMKRAGLGQCSPPTLFSFPKLPLGRTRLYICLPLHM